MAVGIQMKRKGLTETLMVISNWKSPLSPWFMQKYISVVRFNPYPAKLIYLNSHSFEVVSPYRDLQLQWLKITLIWLIWAQIFPNFNHLTAGVAYIRIFNFY